NQKKVPQYKEPTFMNIVRKRTFSLYPGARITYGYETSPRRKELELDKTHFNDAIAISGIESIAENPPRHFYYKQFRKKKRSLHESIPRKGLTKKNTNAVRYNKNVKYRNDYYLNDEVIYGEKCGWIYGYSGGEKSREFLVRDISGDLIKMSNRKNSLSLNGSCIKLVRHNNNWEYAIS
ncbi:MAG: HNH endonuclease, partial [Alphaproteobacteria bacterium]|nr:HNH endonuclease [Alphaproteobacteria bacterium]